VNPELEIGRYLTDEARFPHTAAVGGSVEFSPGSSAQSSTVAIIQEFVEAYGNAWDYSVDALRAYREIAEAHWLGNAVPELPTSNLLELAQGDVPTEISDLVGPYIESARLLGQRTGEMHLALAGAPSGDFAPEPFSRLYQRSLLQTLQDAVRSGLEQVRSQASKFQEPLSTEASRLINAEGILIGRLEGLLDHRIDARRIRIHGDYHLGQVLRTATDFVIIDFEGEPLRPLTERRLKRSPLRDVAGMLRSFHYAASTVMFGGDISGGDTSSPKFAGHAANLWYRWVSASYLRGYRDTVAGSGLLPIDDSDFQLLLDVFLVQKAVYEVGYELNNRPDWLHVPVRGLISLLESW
jgi:maltose alpha-D-glucosyltransferase/alpha-amylase